MKKNNSDADSASGRRSFLLGVGSVAAIAGLRGRDASATAPAVDLPNVEDKTIQYNWYEDD